MSNGIQIHVNDQDWINAAIGLSNLSQLKLALGRVLEAVDDAKQSVVYIDQTADPFRQMAFRTAYADAMHMAGNYSEAEIRFREAEEIQARSQTNPFLFSLQCFRLCTLLLCTVERASWQADLLIPHRQRDSMTTDEHESIRLGHIVVCGNVCDRALWMLATAERNNFILDIALSYVLIERALFYIAILNEQSLNRPESRMDDAVRGVRDSGQQDYIPHALLTRAWLRFLQDAKTGSNSAQEDLDEAWEIAGRGPTKLFMADIHLYRARLFFREDKYPKAWGSAQTDLEAARDLIKQCGYWRRKEELQDAWEAILPDVPLHL